MGQRTKRPTRKAQDSVNQLLGIVNAMLLLAGVVPRSSASPWSRALVDEGITELHGRDAWDCPTAATIPDLSSGTCAEASRGGLEVWSAS